MEPSRLPKRSQSAPGTSNRDKQHEKSAEKTALAPRRLLHSVQAHCQHTTDTPGLTERRSSPHADKGLAANRQKVASFLAEPNARDPAPSLQPASGRHNAEHLRVEPAKPHPLSWSESAESACFATVAKSGPGTRCALSKRAPALQTAVRGGESSPSRLAIFAAGVPVPFFGEASQSHPACPRPLPGQHCAFPLFRAGFGPALEVNYLAKIHVLSHGFSAVCSSMLPSLLSRLFYSWCTPMLRKSFNLVFADIGFASDVMSGCHGESLRKGGMSIASILRFKRKAALRSLGFGFWFSVLKLVGTFIFLQSLYNFLADPSVRASQGWLYASLFCVCQILQLLFENWYMEENMTMAVGLVSGLRYLIARHIIFSDSPLENTTRLLGSNIPLIQDFCAYAPWSVLGPLNLLASLVLLYFLLGWTAFTLLGLVLVNSLLSIYLGNMEGQVLNDVLNKIQERLQKTEELIVSIYHLKVQALEVMFCDAISEIRHDEILRRFSIALVSGCTLALSCVTEFVGPNMLLYGVTLVIGNYLSLASLYISFPVVSFFLDNAGQFSNVLVMLGSFRACFLEFLSLDLVSEKRFLFLKSAVSSVVGVECKDVRFRTDYGFEVRNVNFKISSGDWMFFFGDSGSGKSSLLLGLLGRAEVASGRFECTGSVSYCGQSSWLCNCTLRKNILFGCKFDEAMYRRAVSLVGLESDFQQIRDGDSFLVSGGGSNLSGGQKQRVALARSLYSGRQVHLLDDPFSALDAKMSEKILRNVRMCSGYTCFLVASQSELDLRDNDVSSRLEQGNFHFLKGGELRVPCIANLEENVVSVKDDGFEMLDTTLELAKKPASSKSFLAFVFSMPLVFFFVTVGLLTSVGASVFSNFWVTFWIQGSLSMTVELWLIIYAAIMIASLLTLVASFFSFSGGALFVSRKLHESCMKGICSSAISFFARNTPGEITSRFSNDFPVLDRQAPELFFQVLYLIISLLAVVGVSAYLFPIALAALPIFVLLTIFVFIFFRRGNMALKQLTKLAEAKTVSVFLTARAGKLPFFVFGLQDESFSECCRAIDVESSVTFAFWICQRWFSVRIQTLSVLFGFFTSIVVVILGGSFAALLLSYTSQLGGNVQWALRRILDLESSFVSVRRVLEYCSLESEHLPNAVLPPTNWPSLGKIEFSKVFFSYDVNLAPVIRNLNLIFENGKSFGIVGRTGAGKSSIFALLLGFYPIEGQIHIDGISIKTLQKHVLRSRFGVVSQEPVVFSNLSVRRNIDPWAERRTEQVFALFQALFENVDFAQLDAPICDVFSSKGEYQKICAIRALSKSPKVCFVDEGTSSLDEKSSSSLAVLFLRCPSTKIFIAHQLATIMGCDRIVVMEKGKVVEFDHPKTLLENGGVFSSLVGAWGKNQQKKLENLLSGVNEFENCFICRNSFSVLNRNFVCLRCNKKICSFCGSKEFCFHCLKEEDKNFHLLSSRAIFFDTYQVCACKTCRDCFCRPCTVCSELHCDNCLIYFRNIWNTTFPFCCKSCWPVQEKEIFKNDEFRSEAEVEVFHANFSVMTVEKAIGTCSLCRRKTGVCLSCEICKAYVCCACCGFVYCENKSAQRLILLCSSCSSTEKPSYSLYGEVPPFFCISQDQVAAIRRKESCSACGFLFSFFLQPYSCSECEKLCCRKCYQNRTCQNCRAGKKVDAIFCDGCKAPCKNDVVWVNERRFHGKCVAKYRTQEVCAYCETIAIKAQGLCFFNGVTVHNSCLIPYKSKMNRIE